MTIKNFTFFSPSGTEFPVGANNDGKLYMMLTGMDYGTIRRKDWSEPINTALNVQYINTSIIAGGRYFELFDETVALRADSINYIHANIDLTQTTSPVSLSAETINNSNRIDINNDSGVLKVLIDIITTSAIGVIKAEKPKQVTSLDEVTLSGNARIDGKAVLSNVEVNNSTLLKNTTISGNLTVSGATTSENFTATQSVTANDVTAKNNTTSKNFTATQSVTANDVTAKNNTTTNNVIAKNNTTTNTLIVKGVPGQRSAQFQTPTVYATITGTALEFFTLYKSANVVTCNFQSSPTSGSIPGGGAIVGWITDHTFKPEHTQYFTVFTANGQRCRFTVDPGGSIRSHEPVGKNVEIWDSMQWIVPGTEKGDGNRKAR
jgi:hypothetical protein